MLTIPLAQCSAQTVPPPGDLESVGSSSEVPTEDTLPELEVTTLLDGLDHPWDVVQAPDGTVLTGQRSGGFVVRRSDNTTGPVTADLSDLYARSETGLMGIALARDFAQSRTLYTCQGFSAGGVTDIRVISWTVDAGWTELTRTGTVVSGLPVSTGRHGGCRILASEDGTLLIGTGDSATPSVPQDPNSLGGKVLHVNADGTPAAGNPNPSSPVYTLGHRNVQGLAVQPGTGRLYSVEQGTSVDDELNLLTPGGNYGYRPDRLPGTYDESVPMTDPSRVPGAIEAVWSSGNSTLATASAAFASGPQWGSWDGSVVIGGLKSKKLIFVRLSDDGRSVDAQTYGLEDQYGRLRSVTPTANGSLLVTTDNGENDRVLLVTPSP
ncbi:glucose dehydrogenase [Rhodococcus sp. ACPA4]|uniref:PQQ-dependent sugar dehydrogenase n=1 Tax=unclassified Rhodococcus (in: high G+C Gram-positive bacteria) TaxID=192944 RepID=UPI000BB15763|nr:MULTISPECIES: PQQ-dependent sugar dehydrogenase [unclassified Rhodococcus (in: high G+C Gram-positive bacteria)]PBC38353.1 glucose dehydrogenase [Rhodococcus sp. ACPA4]RZL27578.1 MAG: PQQ-dependent sugar dehydrogenase [Rhodococcus sp. (in: high G+C Gram-positive bacteria)]